MNKDIVKFIKNAILFILILVVSDQLIGNGMEKLYFSLKKGQYAQTTYSLNEAKPKVAIFGSSRALHHYSSDILSKHLNKSVYNLGRDGQFMPYYCGVEDVLLKREKPTIIILDVNVWDLAPNNEKYEKLSMFLPYLSQHPELKTYINEISNYEFLKTYSKTYLYNSTLLISVHDKLFPDKVPTDDRGFFPLERSMDKRDFEIYSEKKKTYDTKRAALNVPLDLKAVEYYKKFLQTTENQNIKTYVIISPTILKEPQTKEKSLLNHISKNYKNVIFIDFSQDLTYNNQYDLFADELHLNKEGTEKFSLELAKIITSPKN